MYTLFPYLSLGISCGHPGDVPHSDRSGGFLFGDVVTYICHTGHHISSGNASRTCQASELWTGDSPICSSETCYV